MRQVLFVRTGNICRSLTAEYALRHTLDPSHNILVASAGTEDRRHDVHPFVSGHLRACGIEVSRHRRRTLTADMLGPAV